MHGKHRPGWIALLLAALVVALGLPATADESDTPERVGPPREPIDIDVDAVDGVELSGDLWFVEFDAPPAARGASAAQHAQERNALRREARAEGVEFEERFDFRDYWNGLSVRASAAEAAVLSTMDSVRAVYPVLTFDLPEPEVNEPAMTTALAMTGADIAQSELGLTGEGIKVGIIDTGIDYQHPDLGGDGEGTEFPTERVAYGFDFAGDDYDASDPNRDEPQPNPDPLDIGGHGTHVAGIVGADAADASGITGVAPEVTFGAYKVFGTTGSSSSDVVIAGMEAAAADGMDVINMSLGAAFGWSDDYPTSAVANELTEDGIIVVASAGNSGAAGVQSMGAPGTATGSISVASADNLSQPALAAETPADTQVPYTGISAAPLPEIGSTSDELVSVGRACLSLGDELEDDPDGRTALIVRGECTFAEKYENAVDAGATGVVIYNNVPGLFAGGGIEPIDEVWSIAISDTSGAELLAELDAAQEAEEVTLTFTGEQVTVDSPTGGLVSSFSSYGLTPDLQFAPDILAPGGLINSTYPLASGGYAVLSGTSMSAPHVAGAIALLLEDEPGLSTERVRQLIQNTAQPVNWSLNPGLGFLEPTFRQGAGMLRIDDALTRAVEVTPSKIALGDAASTEVSLTVTNTGTETVTYSLDDVGTIGTAGFPPGEDEPDTRWLSVFAPGFVGPTTAVSFEETSVTLDPGETTDVGVTITNPAFELYLHQASGYITLTSDDAADLVVPFAGLAGDLADIEIWPEARETLGLQNTQILELIEGENGLFDVEPVEPGHTFSRQQDDVPAVGVFMGYAAQEVTVTAVHESGHEVLVAVEPHVRRSVGPVELLPFVWDGREQVGDSQGRRLAPRGTWYFEIEATLPNDANIYTVQTEEFVLERGAKVVPGGPDRDRRGGLPADRPGRGGPR